MWLLVYCCIAGDWYQILNLFKYPFPESGNRSSTCTLCIRIVVSCNISAIQLERHHIICEPDYELQCIVVSKPWRQVYLDIDIFVKDYVDDEWPLTHHRSIIVAILPLLSYICSMLHTPSSCTSSSSSLSASLPPSKSIFVLTSILNCCHQYQYLD